jgi:hypothetical protein
MVVGCGEDVAPNGRDAEHAQEVVGESRDCTSVTGLGGDAFGRIASLNPTREFDQAARDRYQVGRIDCASGADRRMKITFYGREKQPSKQLSTGSVRVQRSASLV